MSFLETGRLVFKIPSPDDLDHLVRLRSNADVMRYIGDGSPQTKSQIESALEENIAYYKKHGFGFISIFEKDTGLFVGQAGVFHLGFDDTQPEIEVAYRLLPEFWGKGYATELAKALVKWAFTHLPIEKLVAVTYQANQASQNVLNKAGFVSIGEVTWYNCRNPLLGFEVHKAC